jgi:proton-dependent oligopeptide transporter, POT family
MSAATAQPLDAPHPRGIYTLYFTEMWERMSYYGMRSLLALYMINFLFVKPEVGREVLGFNFLSGVYQSLFHTTWSPQPLQSWIYGLYTAFVYLTPLFGGMMADRLIGRRNSVIIGGLLMATGQFLLMSPKLFFPGLIVLILGNGCFKPNISTQVGRLYPEGDPRRDGAFTIFYMGINLGAFFAPLVCGTLGQMVIDGEQQWHLGFASAGVGMGLGVILYFFGQRFLAHDTIGKDATAEDAKEAAQPLTHGEKMGILALVILCALNVVFWGVYEQQGNTMQLWADDRTDWHLLGFDIPSTWFQSMNPFMIFLFAPLLNIVWAWQDKNTGGQPSSVVKMALGCMMLGAAFIVMIGAAVVVPDDQRGSVMWLVGTVFVLTIGELYLSPIGLSLVSKVAPKRLVSMLMGMWFLSSFIGNYMSGFLGTFYETMPKEAFFGMLAALAILTGVIMWLFNRPLRNWLGPKV